MEDKNGMAIEYAKTGIVPSELPVEELVFSAGGGFLFGAVAGFAIKKVIKIEAVVIGLFATALAYLSYKGLIDVKFVAMENITRSALTNASRTGHALNNTATQFADASIYCSLHQGSQSACSWIRSWNVDGVQERIKE